MADITVKVKGKNSIRTESNILVKQGYSATAKNVSMSDLLDVNVSDKTDGAILIYDEATGKFILDTVLQKQTVNGGHF